LHAPRPRRRRSAEAAFSGDARGTLRLRGVPRYDPALGEVTVPDLD